ncbi:MAG: PHP-associated domain-containing protein [Chloroflexota bacterium]
MSLLDPVSIEGTHLGKADLHVHSSVGDGLDTPTDLLEYAERHTDLDLIAITDHDEVEGSLIAAERALERGYRCQVITGSEITTRHGHVLALFVTQRFPALRSLEETLEEVHAAGGICLVPHPLSWLTLSVGRRRLLQVQAHKERHLRFDGIEAFNPTYAGRIGRARAHALNGRLGLAETGGSDSHSCSLVGTGYTLFPGRTCEQLRLALLGTRTRGEGNHWSAGDHLGGAAEQLGRSWIVHPCRKIARALSGSNSK